MNVDVSETEYLIAHGTSRFLKAEKVTDMKRKARAGLPDFESVNCSVPDLLQ